MARIAVVGAGAKAAAIVARAAALRELGVADVPELIVFEADHIGAAWSGEADHTSGFLTLCTPGEKDVGFPYLEESGRDPPVAPALFARFSWAAFLVAEGRMAEWVDRGRDHPSHARWADYLDWVFARAGQPIVAARVTKLRPNAAGWDVEFDEAGQLKSIAVDAVLVTGNGPPRDIALDGDAPSGRMLNAESFWPTRKSLLALEEGQIVVVGDGGAAGTIVAWLCERFAENRAIRIVNVNPMGTLFPRGDGHSERRWFSDPSDWRLLTLDHRRRVLERTEAGVVSARIKDRIDAATNVEYRVGRATRASWTGDEIKLEVEYNGNAAPPVMASHVVSAVGFDLWGRLALVDHARVDALRAPKAAALRAQVEEHISPALALPASLGFPRGLHMPALAGLAHGPGMGNLGCLGLMATKVLDAYLP